MWNLNKDLWVDSEFPFYHFVTSKSLKDIREPGVQKEFFSDKNIDNTNIVSAQQVHGNKVVVADKSHKNRQIKEVDGLITEEPGLGLLIFTADCLSLFFGHKNNRIVGLVHAGWRGLAKSIIFETVNIIKKQFGIDPEELLVNIGPHIQKCCFKIGDDVRDAFNLSKNTSSVSLGDIAEKQLRDSGIERINRNNLCTCCNDDLFFSFRRDKTDQRMMSFITRISK